MNKATETLFKLVYDYLHAPDIHQYQVDNYKVKGDELIKLVGILDVSESDADAFISVLHALDIDIADIKKAGLFFLKRYLSSDSRNHYQILGVVQDVEDRQLKNQYRRLIALFHPDKNPGEESQALRINQAYNALKKSTSRAEYDKQLVRARFKIDTVHSGSGRLEAKIAGGYYRHKYKSTVRDLVYRIPGIEKYPRAAVWTFVLVVAGVVAIYPYADNSLVLSAPEEKYISVKDASQSAQLREEHIQLSEIHNQPDLLHEYAEATLQLEKDMDSGVLLSMISGNDKHLIYPEQKTVIKSVDNNPALAADSMIQSSSSTPDSEKQGESDNFDGKLITGKISRKPEVIIHEPEPKSKSEPVTAHVEKIVVIEDKPVNNLEQVMTKPVVAAQEPGLPPVSSIKEPAMESSQDKEVRSEVTAAVVIDKQGNIASSSPDNSIQQPADIQPVAYVRQPVNTAQEMGFDGAPTVVASKTFDTVEPLSDRLTNINTVAIFAGGSPEFMLMQYVSGYEDGDIDDFMDLFSSDVITNQGAGKHILKSTYGELFDNTVNRELRIKEIIIKPRSETEALLVSMVEVLVQYVDESDQRKYNGQILFRVVSSLQGLQIAELVHSVH